jgi:8-oxo-dGTP pyrophosphatase MutT (NUDIX family)
VTYPEAVLAAIHRLLLQIYRRLPRKARRWTVRVMAPSYTAGAMCFIERPDGAVLFVRTAYRNRWGVPGGLLKRGEDPGAGARREVMEEVGLAIELLGEPTVVVDPPPQRIDIVYRARLVDPEGPSEPRTDSPEIVEARWFRPDELPELQHETAGALVALARSAAAPQAVPLPPHDLLTRFRYGPSRS